MLPKSSLLVARHVKETKISIKSDISIVNTDLVSTGSYVSSSSGGPNREYTWQMELVKCASDFLVNRATLNLILMPSSIPSEVAATCDIILTNILNQEVVRSPGQLKIYKRGERVMLARLPSLLKPPLFTIGCDITIDDSTAVVEGKTLPEFSKNVQVLKHRFSSIMFDNLNDFLESQQLCDVTLITADRAIPAHKAILAAQSPVFLAMFSHEMKEQRKNQVDITDLNAEVVMEMVRFIYTGRTTNLDEMADDLLAAANKYQVLALKDLCVLTLCESIATENVVDRLILGDLYDVVDLKNAALNFICTQGQEVIKTPEYKSLGTTHPHLIAEALEASIMARTEYLTPTAALEECRKRIAECTMASGANVPVCGSDGVTYPSQCQVVSRQCQGESLLIKHTGPCPETPPCFSARLTARPGARPVCRPGGTYAPVQCHTETGYCWCVTPQGRPLPDTSVRHQRPRCAGMRAASESRGGSAGAGLPAAASGAAGASIRSGQRRRASPNWKQRRQYTNRHRNTCDRAEKAKFNDNLIENFRIEYRRTNISVDGDKNVERVLSWKFVTLDKDGDGHLDRAEYKELRRLAKKAVRPKKCARMFARACDLNQDLKLSRQEWGACLGDGWTRGDGFADLLKEGSPPAVHVRPTFNDDPPDTKEESDANDCISDRRSVMEDQRQNSQEKFYIPQCTPDGRYHKVQCYSGYCWCVYQDTGKPIPGTSSKDQTPNCNPVPPPSRPMKGCPDAKKQLFLRDLIDLMEKKMKASSTDSGEATDKWPASKEERVATWHFVMLDKNKNKVLERKEWKSFRTMVANNRHLRRCGKKLPRYCDINNDRRISMTEWLSCLNAQRSTPADSPEKVSTSKPRRMGPNPLDTFLNGDD